MAIELRPLTPDHLDDFKNLLGSSDFGGCFCAVWTSYGPDWEARCSDKKTPNFFVSSDRVIQGYHAGYFVYDNSKLVSWTGSGPKTCFPLLSSKLGSRLSTFDKDTWSIGCIAIKSEFRGTGLADKIVSAVVNLAKTNNAKALEAYPVKPFHEPRIYRGTEGLYTRQGFTVSASEIDDDFEILLMTKSLSN